MIAALYNADGVILQVVIGSSATVEACSNNAGLSFVEWTGTSDAAVVDALDVTHQVVGGAIIGKEG